MPLTAEECEEYANHHGYVWNSVTVSTGITPKGCFRSKLNDEVYFNPNTGEHAQNPTRTCTNTVDFHYCIAAATARGCIRAISAAGKGREIGILSSIASTPPLPASTLAAWGWRIRKCSTSPSSNGSIMMVPCRKTATAATPGGSSRRTRTASTAIPSTGSGPGRPATAWGWRQRRVQGLSGSRRRRVHRLRARRGVVQPAQPAAPCRASDSAGEHPHHGIVRPRHGQQGGVRAACGAPGPPDADRQRAHGRAAGVRQQPQQPGLLCVQRGAHIDGHVRGDRRLRLPLQIDRRARAERPRLEDHAHRAAPHAHAHLPQEGGQWAT